jgi:hypothetical protein
MAKRLSLKAILGKVWDEMAPAVSHGSSEIAASLYTGSGFVMYPRAGQEPMTMDSLRAEVNAKQQSKEGGREQGGREL